MHWFVLIFSIIFWTYYTSCAFSDCLLAIAERLVQEIQGAFPSPQVSSAVWPLRVWFRLSSHPSPSNKYWWVLVFFHFSTLLGVHVHWLLSTKLNHFSYYFIVFCYNADRSKYLRGDSNRLFSPLCCHSFGSRSPQRFLHCQTKMDTEIDQQEETSFSNAESNGI